MRFYAAMAVYGFWQWRQGRDGGALAVCRWPPLPACAGIGGDCRAVGVNWYFPGALHARGVALHRFHGDLVQRLRDLLGGAQGVSRTGIGGW